MAAGSQGGVNRRGTSNTNDRRARKCWMLSWFVCHCGLPAKHWAYMHDDPDERFEPGVGAYSLDLTRYMPMCVSCHKKFDLSLKC